MAAWLSAIRLWAEIQRLAQTRRCTFWPETPGMISAIRCREVGLCRLRCSTCAGTIAATIGRTVRQVGLGERDFELAHPQRVLWRAGRTADVTEFVRRQVRGDSVSLTATNRTFGGDPAIGADKVLIVVYATREWKRHGGAEKYADAAIASGRHPYNSRFCLRIG
jgi:hypothetical protein